ncbi:MAG: tetratricopeptide repeat protein [Myxococcota bacterium]
MIESLNSGWDALAQGDIDRAQRIFNQHLEEGPHGGEVYRGLMRVEAARGNLQQAQTYGERAVEIDDTAVNLTSLADILGRQGKRVEAERLLEHAVQLDSSDPYARALLGEQRIRQGRWEEGTQDYIDALSSDPKQEAFGQFKIVIADMVDAMNQGRIPAEQAQKFINQVDYSVPKSGPDMQSFFGRVRRAIHSGRSMQIQGGRSRDEHSYGKSGSDGRRSGASASAPPPRQASRPQPMQQHARGGRENHSQRRRQPAKGRGASSGSPSSSQSRASSSSDRNLDANQKDLVAVIKRDRMKNRELLSNLPDMPPPAWPSKAGYDSIDDVPAISMDRGAIFGNSTGIDTRDFSVTSGDLLTEIFLERCLRNLLVATQQNKATTIQLRPESFVQMEINCRDGLLGKMRPLSPIYDDRDGFEDFRRLAVGMFIGECIVRTFDGKWNFEVSPEQSYLEVGTVLLEPFELIQRWMSADDKDEVFLEQLARKADRASRESTSMTLKQTYIDPTRELQDQALASKLAETWANYLFSITDASFSDVAKTLEPLEVTDTVIVFAIAGKWAPEYAKGRGGEATLPDGRVVISYLRETGEFLPMASRKSVARLLEATIGELDGQTAGDALEVVARYFRPTWQMASNSESAQEIAGRVVGNVPTPKLNRDGSETTLRFVGASKTAVSEFVVSYDDDLLIPWRLEVREQG